MKKGGVMNKPKHFLVLNGPNLSRLGTREPHIYGKVTLKQIETECRQKAKQLGASLSFAQSEDEAELIRLIHTEGEKADYIIINAAAFSHTSIALLDALKAVKARVAEVHLSNIYQREEFRRSSYISLAADGVISGFGKKGYIMAMEGLVAKQQAE